ncbi:MAG TPA: TonB-dependent receptor [Caulobacteraceae bacterium]|jgi:iron complex outermembrane receptor protein
MTFRKPILLGSTSIAAILCAAAPAMAATDTDTGASAVSEIVVTGIKESLQRAITIKRESVDQVDAVSATDIGKLPDKNVADALQRIPGVNTESAASGEGGFDENDRVSIRGTSPSLTQVTVDGHAVATGDWFILDQFQTVGRSVSFTLLPAEMVQSTVVYKTQDAALLEGGVAGVVDLRTPTALNLTKSGFTFSGAAEGAYNSLRGDWKPQVNATIAWANPTGTFGVSLQGFYEDRSIERFGQETLGYTQITADHLDSTGKFVAGMPLGNQHPELVGVEAPTLIGSTLFQQEKTREGAHFDVDYAPSDRVELNLDGFYSHLDASNVNDNYMYWGSNELNNNLPSSFTVSNNTLTSAVWPKTVPITAFTPPPPPAGVACTTVCTGGTNQDGIIVDNIYRPGANAYTYYINFDGKFKVTDNLTVKTQIGYTQGQGQTASSPFFEADAVTGVAFQPSGNGWQVTPTDISGGSPNGLNNDFAINETFSSRDSEIYGSADADWDVNNGVFKDVAFGFHGAQHTRQVDGWDRGCTLGADGSCFSAGLFPFANTNPTPYPSGFNSGSLGIPGLLIPLAGNTASIQKIINAIPGGVRGPISAIHQPLNYYWPGSFKVQENDYAGYVMARVEGDGWRGNFGVRLVDTQENAFTNVPVTPGTAGAITSSAFGPYQVNHVMHDYFTPLPSVNFTFDLQKNLLLRVSAAETMSRPDYSALGGTVTLSDLTLTGNGGNPNLRPVQASVFDGALEWYYMPTAVAAVSVFYDDLSSYVTFGNHTQTFEDQFLTGVGAPVFKPYVITSPTNTSGQLKGVEFQVQQPLPYNFGFQANFTYVDGEDATGAPLVGTSKITYNIVGYYEVERFNIRLAYTYRSHYLVGLDRSSAENEAGNGELDASANYNLTKNVTLTVDALNITDPLLKYYANNTTQVRAVYENGTQVYAGVHVKF